MALNAEVAVVSGAFCTEAVGCRPGLCLVYRGERIAADPYASRTQKNVRSAVHGKCWQNISISIRPLASAAVGLFGSGSSSTRCRCSIGGRAAEIAAVAAAAAAAAVVAADLSLPTHLNY